MPDDPLVQKLLDDLFERQATPEEVCTDFPELLPVVRMRWRQICRTRAELDSLFPIQNENPTAPKDQQLPLLPGYEVIGVLGYGGMGIVFRARHLKLSRLVAVKMSLAGCYANEQERERFRREAEAVAALRHANVVQIYDVGDTEGRPYFVMELMEGGSLAQKQAGQPQTPRAAAQMVATLAEAVHAAHQGGIVHRDLKPANILFTLENQPKITDFGLARRIEAGAELTLSGMPLGTPSYMSPEQALGRSREIGPAADIYALGVILYELLTGHLPFRGETAPETLQRVIHDEPVPPSRLNRKVPRDLQTICLCCLQKEPRLRYVTAAALADDLQRFLRGEAIAMRVDPYFARWVRRIARQPALSAAIFVAVFSTLGVAAGGLWFLSDRSAKANAASDDIRDMRGFLARSRWVEAGAARDRAHGRLGESAPADLLQLIDRGSRDLELARHLEDFHKRGAEAFGGGVQFENYHNGLANAFRKAGMGTLSDDAAIFAQQIRNSDIRDTVIDVLDWYAVIAHRNDRSRSVWALEVAQIADPDQSEWRRQARDPRILDDRMIRNNLIANRPTADPSKIPHAVIELYLSDSQIPNAERVALARQLQKASPGDFWLNLRLGGLLWESKNYSESLGYLQAATALNPESAVARFLFGNVLHGLERHAEAVEQWQLAVTLNPETDVFRKAYMRYLVDLKRDGKLNEEIQTLVRNATEAAVVLPQQGQVAAVRKPESETLAALKSAVEADPRRLESQKALRDYWLSSGQLQEAHLVWHAAIEKQPTQFTAWYGYPELSLFLGKTEEYQKARSVLLSRFQSISDPRTAETLSRMALLLPAEGNELETAVRLSHVAVDAPSAKTGGYYAYFLFARGLGEYRQNRLDEAIVTMSGDAARVLGPAPRLVLAMALHRKERVREARYTLAAAVTGHDWRIEHCRNQDAWIYHILRREAEQMILPNLPAFLAGEYQPSEVDERLSFLGHCQELNRTLAMARLYEGAFAVTPTLKSSMNSHRYAAARAAALAGCGQGSDVSELDTNERARWRRMAMEWQREELVAIDKAIVEGTGPSRAQTVERLVKWQAERDFAGLREPSNLEELPFKEREQCQAFWSQVGTLITRAKTPH